MTRTTLILAVLTAGALARSAAAQPAGLPGCPTASDAPEIAPLIQRVEQTLQGASSIMTMTMTIRTAKWSRVLKMKLWAQGDDHALVRILEGGPRETGMMTLKRDKQLWNYLPEAGRVMKLPSGMLGDSWMGSDFTNDDLVRGTSLVKDFDAKVTGTAVRDQRRAWRIASSVGRSGNRVGSTICVARASVTSSIAPRCTSSGSKSTSRRRARGAPARAAVMSS